jgi:hypothetical protein
MINIGSWWWTGSNAALSGTAVSPPVNTVLPSIDNLNPVVGDTLTRIVGTWTNTPTSYSYDWYADAVRVQIGGTTYMVLVGDIGAVITVQETASNAGGPGTPAVSDPTNAVIDQTPINNVAPTIATTTPTVGNNITVTSTGDWTNQPTAYTYQWQRDAVDIAAATSNNYTAVTADSGKALTCVVIASNSNPTPSAPVSSNATDLVLAPPINTVAPLLTTDGINAPSGPSIAGDNCTVTDGTWTGYPAPTFTYTNDFQNGGTANTVVTGVMDTGQTRKFTVTATNTSGAVPADSNGMSCTV